MIQDLQMKRSDQLPIRHLTPANISAQKFPIKVKGNQGVIDNDMMKPATKCPVCVHDPGYVVAFALFMLSRQIFTARVFDRQTHADTRHRIRYRMFDGQTHGQHNIMHDHSLS
jgi:hypothetical protein